MTGIKSRNSLAMYLAALAFFFSLIALGGVFLKSSPAGSETKKETAFERVMRTRTLRCAYAMWPPRFMIDNKTGEKSGINYEIMEAIGKVANLKIEWVEEVGYGAFPENLRSGKEDAFCSGAWMSVPRGQRVEYVTPTEYTPLYAYVREGDSRFDHDIAAVNDEKYTIATVDGSTMAAVAEKSFPKAKKHALPSLADDSPVILAVAEGKADVTFLEDMIINDYNKHNPDKKLRRVLTDGPVRTFGASFSVAKGEWELRDMLNVALAELQGDGTIESIIRKYEPAPGAILRIARPYANPAGK
ncbi:MAG: transporter substrate-binding domain-containing protein [Alphaproteobacteria bacterium]|nr:transporter substrate-binding domain-containing protein [Alphaproteobacteria bacterium]